MFHFETNTPEGPWQFVTEQWFRANGYCVSGVLYQIEMRTEFREGSLSIERNCGLVDPVGRPLFCMSTSTDLKLPIAPTRQSDHRTSPDVWPSEGETSVQYPPLWPRQYWQRVGSCVHTNLIFRDVEKKLPVNPLQNKETPYNLGTRLGRPLPYSLSWDRSCMVDGSTEPHFVLSLLSYTLSDSSISPLPLFL